MAHPRPDPASSAPNVDAIRDRAADLIAWADGYEATDERHARRCRTVARDVLQLAQAYQDEAAGRHAMQANYERALAVMHTRLYANLCATGDDGLAEAPTNGEAR